MTVNTSLNDRWSDEEKTVVAQMWTDGFSASQISTKIHDVFKIHRSRNSVIGIVHRAGMGNVARKSAFNPAANLPKAPKAPSAPRPKADLRHYTKPAFSVVVTAPPKPEPPREGPGLATIHTLGAHMCKWPIGDPTASDFTFCGAARDEDDRAYCPGHRAIAGGGRIEPKKADISRMARYAR